MNVEGNHRVSLKSHSRVWHQPVTFDLSDKAPNPWPKFYAHSVELNRWAELSASSTSIIEGLLIDIPLEIADNFT